MIVRIDSDRYEELIAMEEQFRQFRFFVKDAMIQNAANTRFGYFCKMIELDKLTMRLLDLDMDLYAETWRKLKEKEDRLEAEEDE